MPAATVRIRMAKPPSSCAAALLCIAEAEEHWVITTAAATR